MRAMKEGVRVLDDTDALVVLGGLVCTSNVLAERL